MDLVFIFDGTFDGFLNTIYVYYYEKLIPSHIVSSEGYQQILNAEYINIETNFQKARRVYEAIFKKISLQAHETIYHAFLFADEYKYMDLFNYVVLGFKVKGLVDNYTQMDYVVAIHKYAHAVLAEAHLLKGFCRFSETDQGIYYCKITPKHDVLPILSEHFADRLNGQHWVIHDTARGIASVYDKKTWLIASVGNLANVVYSETEEAYRSMWHTFFKSIAIEDRENVKLQKKHINRRYRQNAHEFTAK